MNVDNALARRPGSNLGEGITTVSLGSPSFAAAREQHAAYCDALHDAGANVAVLEAAAAYPDAHFVEDTAVVTAGRAVLTRPGASARAGEVPAIRAALKRMVEVIGEIAAPGTVDGGDVCEAGETFYVGISARTNLAGAAQLGELLAASGKSVKLVDIRAVPGILHLKSGMSYLGDGCFVAIDALVSHIDAPRDRIIRVGAEEAYGANCVHVNDTVLVAAGHPRLQDDLARGGYSTVALDVSEFRKMDGGLSCLSLRF